MKRLDIASFPCESAVIPTETQVLWSELCSLLSRHHQRTEKANLPCWSPTQYGGRKRREKENVERLSCFVLDIDNGSEPLLFKRAWKPYAYHVHSSYSHTEGYPKWRAVFPLIEPVPAADWPEVYAKLYFNLGRCHSDQKCKDAGRLYFLPCCPPARMDIAFSFTNEGDWIDHNTLQPLDIAPPREEKEPRFGSRRVSQFEKVDYRALAYGEIPEGDRHDTLIRAILRARRENWEKDAIELIVQSFHDNTEHFGRRTKNQSLHYYLGEIDHTWAKFEPDGRFVKEVVNG